MAVFKRQVQKFTPQNDQKLDWPTFNGGWNNFFKPTELAPNELAQADNMMLIGKGTPTGRWGSLQYFLGGTGNVRNLDAYYNSNTSTNILLTITDLGLLVQKTNASYTAITGASFLSGSNYMSSELGNNIYYASVSQAFVKFDGTNLIPYVSLSAPTNVSVAQVSAASGFNTYSWMITATSQTGESLGSVNKTLASLPLDLKTTSIKVSWNTVSAAASVLTGYNIYRGSPGNETYLASLDSSAVQYYDNGAPASNTLFPPLVDNSGGPRAKYILKLNDRLVLAGIPGDGSKLLVSGRYPYHDRFTALQGGGYVYVAPNDGDDIKGIGLANLQTTTPLIVVFKSRSTHVVAMDTITLGNFQILDLQSRVLTNSFGASSGDACVQVENDYYAFGNKGLFSTGQEPQFFNQIRTNELSSRIRTYVQSLSNQDFSEAAAGYMDYKYILSFPSKRETIIYDRLRMAFMGPWKHPSYGVTKWLRYFDAAGSERWLAGCTDSYVREFSPAYTTDDGVTIGKTLRTRKEDMGQWNMMKILKYFYILFRNIRGSVTFNLRLETRTGNTITAKTATISSALGTSGWGTDAWGTVKWGTTNQVITLSGDELARYSQIFTQFRVMQVEVVTTASSSNFELLAVRATSTSLGPASLPSALKV